MVLALLQSLAELLLLSSRKNSPHSFPRVGSMARSIGRAFIGRFWTYLQLLEVWPLHADHSSQQLVLQAIPCHSEVDQSGLSLQLRLVVRISQLGVKDKPELWIVFTLFLSNFNKPGT